MRHRRHSRRQRAGQSTGLSSTGTGPKPFQTVGNTFGSSPQQASAQALEQSALRQAEMNKALSGGSDTSRATYVVPSFSNGGTGPMSATNISVAGNSTLVEHQANSVYDKYAFVGGRLGRSRKSRRSSRRRSRKSKSRRRHRLGKTHKKRKTYKRH